MIANVNEFGWHAVNVIEDDGHPPWTYTIGFYETWNYPEIIIMGRSRASAHHILDTIAVGLDGNQRPDLNLPTETLIPASPFFLQVADRYHSDYVGFARWFYRGKPFPLYQFVWPNNDGHYPWHPNASEPFREWQPVLGEVQRRLDQ